METPTVQHPEDYAFVQRILAGDARAWNQFVEQYSDRSWRRSWRLCNEACHNRDGKYFCVFHALNRNSIQPSADPRPGCDDGLEIYAYIFDYFYNPKTGKGKLNFYDGRAKLDTFVASVLHGNLRTDWIRHKRKVRVDQIKRPPEIQTLAPTDQAVFDQMVLQRGTETIMYNLRLDLADVELAQERVTHALISKGNLHLILRNPEATSLDQDDRERAGDTARILPIRRAMDDLWQNVCALIAELPDNEKILLDMTFNADLDAKTILDRCLTIGLELPVSPRDGEPTIHNIYQSIETILKRIGKKLETDYAQALRDYQNALDEDWPAATQISVKGLKAMLKSMGLDTKAVFPTKHRRQQLGGDV